jgi:PAS domain S-box-containing protein
MNSLSQSTPRARRDLFILISALLISVASASSLELSEAVGRLFSHLEAYQLDEIMLALAISSVAFAWYAYRRWQEYKSELSKNANVNEKLEQAQRIAKLGHWSLNARTGELLWSDEIYRIFGRRPREFEPSYERFFAVVHPEDVDAIKQSEQRAFARGEPHSIDHRVVLPDGSIRWVHEEAVAKFGDDGKLLFLTGTVQDITERKRAEAALQESERLLQTIIDNIPVRVFWKDPALNYLGCNPAFASDAGKDDPAEMIGRDDYQMGWANQAELYRADDQEVIDSGVAKINVEEPQTTPDGGTIWLRTSKVPLKNLENETIGVLGIYYDITSEKKVHAELVRDRDDLQALVDEATKQLRTKANELELALTKEKELNELQRQFVAMASHEIRTPLAIIDSSAQRLLRHGDRMPPEDVAKRLSTIRTAVQRLTSLMESTLSAERMEAGKLQIRTAPCHLDRVIRDVCARQQELTPRCSISFDLDDLPETVMADRAVLDQVFTNLLSNAVKYSRGAAKVHVRAWRDGGDVLLSVRDNGLGIDQEDLPMMFTRFFRAKTSTGIAGTGIGLNLVKKFIEAHDGTVAVESRVGEGSTFTIRLPQAGPAASGRQQDAA